jgi:hypothetical protein
MEYKPTQNHESTANTVYCICNCFVILMSGFVLHFVRAGFSNPESFYCRKLFVSKVFGDESILTISQQAARGCHSHRGDLTNLRMENCAVEKCFTKHLSIPFKFSQAILIYYIDYYGQLSLPSQGLSISF